MRKILLLFICLMPNLCFAGFWQNLWLTPNQQAAILLQKNEAAKAAEKFTAPAWQGYANYKAENYQQAVQDFSRENSALANFNRGNALTQLGQYQSAIDAYNAALKQNPEFADASFNKSLVEKMLPPPARNPQKNNKPESPNKQNQSQNTTPDPKQNSDQTSQQNTSQNNPQSPQTQKSGENSTENSSQQQETSSDRLTAAEENALNQWLQKIPDDPGGLLKEKFLRDHLRIQAQEHAL